MKKRILSILAIACSLFCCFSASCSKCKENQTEEPGYERKEDTLSLETSVYNKKVGETDFVVPMGYTAVEGVNLAFESSNADVVKVNQYGEFIAYKEGTATIKVTYGNATAEATVNVGWGNENPRIRMHQTIESTGELNVSGLEPFDLGLWVYYNAKKWNDATYEYTVADPSVGNVVDGRFVPAKKGTTSVTVKATWRDKTCASMEKTFTVTVSDEIELSVNDGFGGVIQLYTRESVGSASYVTSSRFEVIANKHENGTVTPLPVTVQVLDEYKDIVEYDAENKIVRAKGIAGTAIINMQCQVDGETYTATAKVIVDVSVGEYESTAEVEFSALDGLFFADGAQLEITDIFQDNSATLVSASVAGTALTIYGDSVLGLKTPSKETLETTITIASNSVGYHIPVTAYTKIIDEAQDLDVLCLDVTDYGISSTPRSIEGYYVLASDIDASNYAMKTQGSLKDEKNARDGGFKGVFDGRGHIISDVTFGYDLQLPADTRDYWNYNDYSLFGVIANGALIKNFAITNVTYDLTNTGGGGNINVAKCSPMGSWVFAGATIENVYISTKGTNRAHLDYTHIYGFAQQVRLGTNLNNIIIDDTYVVTEGDGLVDMSQAKYKAAFSYRRNVEDTSLENNWSNVIVLSNSKCTYNYPDSAYDASNITLEEGSSFMTMPNIYRYESIEEFVKAKDVNYAQFGNVWDKGGYVPTWKGIRLEKYLFIELDGKTGDKFEIDKTKIDEVDISFSVNGQDNVAVQSVTVDNDCVTYENGKLKINAPGEAVVTAVLRYDNQNYTLTATISVVADVETYAKTVEFSAMHGTLPVAEIFGNANTEIVLAYQGNQKLSVENNKIKGVTLTEKDKVERIELTVYSQTKGYNVICNAYAGIISKAEDLEIFNLNMTDYANYAQLNDDKLIKAEIPTITGYYVLANNIDASTYQMNTQGYIPRLAQVNSEPMAEHGFRGTFDGCGYTISGLTLGRDINQDDTYRTTKGSWRDITYSLFGIIGNGGTIKNFALTDVKFHVENSGSTYGIAMANCTPIATWILPGATVENVYVSLKGTNYINKANSYLTAFAFGVDTRATLNNIVVDDTYVVTTGDGLTDASPSKLDRRASFAYRKIANQDTTDNSWNNVVCISNIALTSSKEALRYDGSNITTLETGYVNMPNTYRYESVGAWKTAQADTGVHTKPNANDFSTNYWHLVDGVPVWGKTNN